MVRKIVLYNLIVPCNAYFNSESEWCVVVRKCLLLWYGMLCLIMRTGVVCIHALYACVCV